MYQRCIIACRTNSDQLYLKLYKDVLSDQIEQLLPKTKLAMTDIDRAMTAVSLLVACGTSAFHLSHNQVFPVSTLAFFSAIALGMRAWNSVTNKRNKYLAEQMRTLYYQNINNNRGLLALLVDRAEDEEFKEAALAFTFVQAMPCPIPVHALTRRIENWLFSEFRVEVCFDVHDALDKLRSLGLVEVQGTTITSVLPPASALAVLEDIRNRDLYKLHAKP